MDFRLLGPLEIRADGRATTLAGARQRTLLAVLLVDSGRLLPVEQLYGELWGEAPPPTVYFDVQHDAEPLGQGVGAMLWLTVAPAALSAAGQALAAHREVGFAAAITGRSNLVAAVVTPDSAALYTYLSERVGALDGVHAVETALTLRQVKQLTYEPAR